FETWGLQPFEPVRLAVDTTSLSSPQWIPSAPGYIVAPYPSEVASVRIPILIGSVIEGRLEVQSGEASAPLRGSVGLRLENSKAGESRELEVFSDGSFYLMGVPPGSYLIRPDRAALSTLGLDAEPLAVDVAPAADAATRSRALVVALRPSVNVVER